MRKRHRIFASVVALIIVVPFILIASGWALALIHNNKSSLSDDQFRMELDQAIEKAQTWLADENTNILNPPINIAMVRMIDDCQDMRPSPLFGEILDRFHTLPMRPYCWKALVLHDTYISPKELQETIANEVIDQKWILFAMAPDKAGVTAEQLALFDPEKWQMRQLTHQLWALVHFQQRQGTSPELEELINHLCERLKSQLQKDIPVVDIYIQKIAFVLFAGHPEKINRRWIERVIANQKADGGWNDRWFCFESRRRPQLDFADPPSNEHASVQGLWLLYQVKYRYPEHFGLPTANSK